MVKDFKYIVKRIIIGTGIALVLSFLRGNLFIMTYAQTNTYNASTSCVFQTSSNETCKTPPNTVVGGNQVNIWWTQSTLLQPNKTYFLEFRIKIIGLDSNVEQFNQYGARATKIFTGNNGSASSEATPDRNENFSFYHIDRNTAWLVWTFEIDSLSTFNTIRVSFYTGATTGTVGGITYIQGGIESATLRITGDSTSSGGSTTFDDTNIINNANDNANNIINNQNQNTQNQITNNNNNTTNIINNQNENSNNEIASQNVCRVISNNTLKNVGYLGNNGVFSSQTSGTNRTSDFIAINSQASFKLYKQSLGSNYNYRYCFYKSDKTYISCGFNQSLTEGNNITIPSNARFLRFTINLNGGPTYEICSNGNQAINDSLNDLNNNLTDDSGIEDSEMSNFFDDFDIDESNSPVSDFLTMPITLMTAYVNGMSSTCSPVSLGSLYGTTLTLPCINLQTYFGANLWSLIDALFCFYMVYNIGMLCVSIYESITSLSDGFQLLYEPQHTGHSRVSRNEGLY